jgi:hypothetical protein
MRVTSGDGVEGVVDLSMWTTVGLQRFGLRWLVLSSLDEDSERELFCFVSVVVNEEGARGRENLNLTLGRNNDLQGKVH